MWHLDKWTHTCMMSCARWQNEPIGPCRGQRAHFSKDPNGEDSGNQALLHKHPDFINTTGNVCSATTLIFTFLLKDSLSKDGKSVQVGVHACLCPSHGSVPRWSGVSNGFYAVGLLGKPTSVKFYGHRHFNLFFLFFTSFSVLFVQSIPLGKNQL